MLHPCVVYDRWLATMARWGKIAHDEQAITRHHRPPFIPGGAAGCARTQMPTMRPPNVPYRWPEPEAVVTEVVDPVLPADVHPVSATLGLAIAITGLRDDLRLRRGTALSATPTAPRAESA
jgi:hypothetical protein